MTSQSTSDPVSVRLFGRLTVLVGDDVVSGSLSSIARELLAYLLLHRSRDHARSILVGQFWGDLSESDARYALRQALWQIRGAIGERLVADSFSVGLATDAAFEVDVEEFQRRTSHLVRATDAPSALPVSIDRAGEARDLRAALALYRGDLLEEMTHPTIEAERERLRERYLHALLRLCAFEKSAENFEGALELALRITAVEPLQEAAHREAMRIYYLLGRPREALRHFERCSAVLIDELGIGPDAETARLAAEIGARIEDAAISAAYLPEPERDPPLVIKRPLELPLVGRQRERREILEALRAGLGGHSALLLVEGAPGLGKSRLLQEAVRDATWRGYDALMRGAGAWRSESPYGAVLETLGQGLSPVRARQIVPRLDRQARSVIAALMPRLTSVVPELAEALFVPTITDVEPVVDAVGGLIEAWTRRAPLLLALDDLQWADGDSLSLVASLVSRLESAQLANGVVLVLAYRGADARSRPLFWSQLETLDESPLLARRLRLEPLGVEDTARLVRRGLGYRRPASPLEEQVHRTTQGSPLFVLEYLAASLEAGRLVKSDTGEWCIEEAAVSDPSLSIRRESVEQTIADRLDGVPPLAQHVVAAAATLGTDVDYGTLRDATQLEGDALLESLLELRQRRLLFESAAGLHFSHDVVREVAYDRLSADERTALHANVAQAIEQRHASQSELLARHFEKAGAWEKVIEYASEAGARAERVHAPHAAITHYSRALAAYERLAPARSRDQQIRRFELLERRQRLLGQVGEIAAQEEDLSSLSALATALVTPTFEIRALVGRAHFLIDARDAYAEAQESAERALALARLHHLPDQSARALEAIGAACLASTNYRRAEEVLEEARRTWDAISPRSGDGLRAATTLAEVYFRSASRQRAQDLLEVVREQAKEGGNTLLLHDASLLLAGIARRRARYDDAIELGETARALAQQAGEKRREARSTMALALYLWLARQYRRSHEMFLAALEIARQLGNRRSMLYTAMNLAELYVEVGRYDDARALLARGRAQLKHVDSLSLELYYLATQVLLELGAGSDEGARSAAELVIQLPARPGFRMELAWLHYVLGRSALARGELDGARDHLANASALYDATDDWENASAAQAYLGYCHQLLGDADTALALTSAAYDSALTHGQGEAIQAVFYVHARVLESLGHVGPASEALQRAYDAVRHQTGALPEGWEDAFERDVPINRAILECYRSQRRCLTVSLPVAAPRGANTRREVTLEWTLSAPGDQAYTRKPERRQHRLRRLLDEARAAGAAPSTGDLARALSVSERTVERDLAVLRRDQS